METKEIVNEIKNNLINIFNNDYITCNGNNIKMDILFKSFENKYLCEFFSQVDKNINSIFNEFDYENNEIDGVGISLYQKEYDTVNTILYFNLKYTENNTTVTIELDKYYNLILKSNDNFKTVNSIIKELNFHISGENYLALNIK